MQINGFLEDIEMPDIGDEEAVTCTNQNDSMPLRPRAKKLRCGRKTDLISETPEPNFTPV
jgi:hypothetical protein